MTHPYKRSRSGRFEQYTELAEPPEGVYDDCWLWTGRIVDGYGGVWDRKRDRLAHVVAYEHFIGKVPRGMEVSHVCKRRHCVNPDHLELLNHKEVVNKGDAPTAIVHRTGICKKGLHKLEGENVIHTSDGFQTCRACRKEAQREWYLRKLARQQGRGP